MQKPCRFVVFVLSWVALPVWGCALASARESPPVGQAGLTNETKIDQQKGDRTTVNVAPAKDEDPWLMWMIVGIAVGAWILPAPFDPIRRWHLRKQIEKHNGVIKK